MLNLEIAEFGRRMNMEGLSLGDKGLLILDIENIGRLHLEKKENSENLYVYLSLPYQSYDNAIPRKILEICSYRHAHPFPIRGGVHSAIHNGEHNNWVLLLAEFKPQEISAAALENTVRTLASLLEKVFD